MLIRIILGIGAIICAFHAIDCFIDERWSAGWAFLGATAGCAVVSALFGSGDDE